MKPYCIGLALGCSAMLFAGCGGGNDAKDHKDPKIEPPAKAGITDVWLQVDGMSKRFEMT